MALYCRCSLLYFLLIICVLLTSLFSGIASAEDSVCARVKIEIRQEASFERQAFDAHMQINNGLTTMPLEDIHVDVLFADEQGSPVRASSDPDDADALFFIRVHSMTGTDDVSGSGIVAPSATADIHWLIIPASASVEDSPTGKLYYVGAKLSYSLGGEEHVTEVTPDYITVKPLPLLQLDYFLPDEVYGDDPFTSETEESIPFSLGVRVSNNGYGAVKNFKIDSAQPKIVENEQGLLVDFLIEGSEVNGAIASDTLLIEFGDIAPNESSIGRWLMSCSLSGRFVEFDAEYTHSNELGGQLTSLLDSLQTHFLVQDVLVDAPGRDTIRDFLGRDNDVYQVYESDAGISEVTDLSSEPVLKLVENKGDTVIYSLQVSPTAGFVYFRFDDPENGSKVISQVVRSDGKVIKPENGWSSRKRVGSSWTHYGNIFDYNSDGSYTVTLISPSLVPQPPAFEEQSVPVHKEGERLEFLIELQGEESAQPEMQMMRVSRVSRTFDSGAATTDSTEKATISVDRLPVGAEFIDLGNGTALLRWTPQEGQSGEYPLTFTASDGDLVTTVRYHLEITESGNTPTAHFSAASQSGVAPLVVQFTDESISTDGISNWMWDLGDGTISLERHPEHVYENPGDYTVSLTVFERDGDESTYTSAEPIVVEDASNNFPIIETGKIVASDSWQSIQIKGNYLDPIIVASVTGAVDQEPAFTRIRNITPSSFEIRLEPGLYIEDSHKSEEVSYLIVEKGRYTLDDGTAIVADHVYSAPTKKFLTHNFTTPFTVDPVIISSLNSVENVKRANVVMRRIKTNSFDYFVQHEEKDTTVHGNERIDIVAWEPSSGLIGMTLFEVNLFDKVNGNWKQINFTEQFNGEPLLVASRQTFNGNNPATLLCNNITPLGFETRIAEDTSRDSELKHLDEKVGFIAITSLTAATDGDGDGDGISDRDERLVYGTHPGKTDSDDDGADDKTELDFWGASWSVDLDGDGIINLLDDDSDNDGLRDGFEIFHNYDPADSSSYAMEPIMAAGVIMVDHQWQSVTFQESYLDPVVVGTITHALDAEPASVRIKNIGPDGFQIRLEEGLSADGIHQADEVTYIVMDRARYTLADGTLVEAGYFTSSDDKSFATYAFNTAFNEAPVVIGSLSSTNDSTPANIAIRAINATSFDVRLQPEEAIKTPHGAERVDFIGWEPSAGLLQDLLFEVGTLSPVNHQWQEFSLLEQFNDVPFIVASRQTSNGNNPATILCRNATEFGFETRVAEDTSSDSEVFHVAEVVGYIAVTSLTAEVDSDGDGISDRDERLIYGTHPGKRDSDGDGVDDTTELEFWGTSWSSDPDGDGVINLLDEDSDNDGFTDGFEIFHNFDPADPSSYPVEPIMAVGILMVDHEWQSVIFQESYFDPVVVGTITHALDTDPAAVRFRNIHPEGFEIRLEEGLSADGIHLADEVTYIVMDRARYTLTNGTLVEALSVNSSADGKYGVHSLSKPFNKVPVVIGSIASGEDPDPAVLLIKNITESTFKLLLQPEEAVHTHHGVERVDLIAWEPSISVLGTSRFEVGSTTGVTGKWKEVVLSDQLISRAGLIAGRQTVHGSNPATLLCRGLSDSGFEARMAEDTSADAETRHLGENIGYIAIGAEQ